MAASNLSYGPNFAGRSVGTEARQLIRDFKLVDQLPESVEDDYFDKFVKSIKLREWAFPLTKNQRPLARKVLGREQWTWTKTGRRSVSCPMQRKQALLTI